MGSEEVVISGAETADADPEVRWDFSRLFGEKDPFPFLVKKNYRRLILLQYLTYLLLV